MLYALLKHSPDLDVSTQAAATRSAETLAAALADPNLQVEAKFDDKLERYVLAINRMQHGVARHGYIDADFLQSGDYAQIKRTAEVIHGLLSEGAHVKRGDHLHPVKDFREAIEWVLSEVQRGVSTQRYKGLGEMNPEQLWQTTLDPANRSLLRVEVAQADVADEIFTRLMGDVVEPRREFIQENALSVANLDV